MRSNEMNKWTECCVSHPNLHLEKACLHVQIRFMGNLGLNAGVPWLSDMDGLKCFIFKNGVEDASHSFLIASPAEKTSLSYDLT